MSERSEFGCRAALGSGAQGTGDGFIVTGAASVADGFGYFFQDKGDPRVSAETFDFKEQYKGPDNPKIATPSRMTNAQHWHPQKANVHGFPPSRE